jgi:hypothetical protein
MCVDTLYKGDDNDDDDDNNNNNNKDSATLRIGMPTTDKRTIRKET